MPNKQWHPQFVTSLKEALSDSLPGDVEIIPEMALSSKLLDVDVVAKITGLGREDIIKLKNDLN